MVLWLKYEPQELVDTSNLSSEEWLSYRRRGIGGSDAAAILGISPWRTARDLYYDKLNVVKADMDENWVALEMGHLLEDLVARIFAKKTGLHIFQRKVMFQHPLYPWMLADLDYLVELPDGSNAILEIKTTNYNARENWWYNGEEIVPVYYESQGRHYMSVMNLDRVYFCCLYGNNEDEVIIRHLDRDYAYESELIALEDAFWNDHVQKHQPPDYTESGDLILQSLQRWKGIDRRDLPPAAFGAPQVTQITSICSFRRRKTRLQNRSHSWIRRCSSSKACLSANWMVKTARPARTVNKATLSPTIPFAGRASPRIIWFACGRFTRRFTHSLWKRRSPDGSASKSRRSPPHK